MAKQRTSNKWCVKRFVKNVKILLQRRSGRRCSEPCAFPLAEEPKIFPLSLEPEELQALEHVRVQEQLLQQQQQEQPKCDSLPSPSLISPANEGDSSRSSTSTSVSELEDTLVEMPGDEGDFGFWRYNELEFLDEWTIAQRDLSLKRVITTSEKETVYR